MRLAIISFLKINLMDSYFSQQFIVITIITYPKRYQEPHLG